MAEKKNTQQGDNGTTRRGFIGAIGAAAAAAAAPGVAFGAGAPRPLAWPEALAEWPGAFNELAERFRPLYRREVARLAEELRPRFESGELRAFEDEDLEDGESGATSPMWRIEAEAGEHFRLVKRDGSGRCAAGEVYEGAGHIASLILVVSPSTFYVGDDWSHVAYRANAAAMWDVILHARERGWYTPSPDEEIGPPERLGCA
jgi:hypothetical protein